MFGTNGLKYGEILIEWYLMNIRLNFGRSSWVRAGRRIPVDRESGLLRRCLGACVLGFPQHKRSRSRNDSDYGVG